MSIYKDLVEHKKCVSVADSSSAFRMFIKRVIADVIPDLDAILCEDGMEVIEFFEGGRNATPCLVLLDIGRASFDLVKWLREQRGLLELPAIIWTSAPLRAEEKLAEQYGATDYLKKPDTFGELLPAVRDLYEGFCL